ncbi:MAG: exosortase/archaeosortase family protein [Bacteroidales bacterium]
MKQKFGSLIKTLSRELDPFKGLITLALVLLFSHILWHLLFEGDVNSDKLALLGYDITDSVKLFSQWQADVLAKILDWANIKVEQYDRVVLFEHGRALRIIWGCTAIKQSFSLFFVILFCAMRPLTKLTYMPIALVSLILFNFFRLYVISYFYNIDPNTFHFWHEFFRFAIYGFVGIIWVVGVELYDNLFKKSDRKQ